MAAWSSISVFTMARSRTARAKIPAHVHHMLHPKEDMHEARANNHQEMFGVREGDQAANHLLGQHLWGNVLD